MIGNFLTNQMRTFWILEKSAGIDTNDDIDCLTFFTNVLTTLELPNVRLRISAIEFHLMESFMNHADALFKQSA